MASDFNSIEDIQAQLDRTTREIQILRSEIEAEDLDRYPNFEDRLNQFRQSVLAAGDVILQVADLGHESRRVNVERIIEETENAIDVVNSKLIQTQINTLVSILNLLLELQRLLQELNMGDDTSTRRYL